MRFTFREKPYDLLAVAVLSAVLVGLVAVSAEGALRIAFGVLFVILLPGYALTAALFPKDGEIDWIERAALSLGLSLAVVPLLGLLLNYTPWGIRLEPVIATLFVFTLGMCGIAYWRRLRLAPEARLGLSIEFVRPKWEEYGALDKGLAVALAAALVLAGATVVYVVTVPRPGAQFTEFYVLDENRLAQDYPSELAVGEEGVVTLGIVNHEFRTVNYTIQAVLVTVEFVFNETLGRDMPVDRGSVVLDELSASVPHETVWESAYAFSIVEAGDYRLHFLLFDGGPGGEPLVTPLQLFIRVG